MATQFKFTAKRGADAPHVTVAAGTAIAGGDAIELNVDATKMTKSEALQALEAVQRAIIEGPWFPL